MKKQSILLLWIIWIISVLFYWYWLNNVVLENQIQKQKEFPKEIPWVEPYREKLPPMPDKKLNDSTLLWIDSNANGVRDDLEILIVETYGADKMVVEAFFAYVRSRMLDLKIVQEWRFTDELYENDMSLRNKLSVSCSWKYFYNSMSDNASIDFYNKWLYLSEKIYNTKMRRGYNKELSKLLDNRIILWWNVSENECENFFKETNKFKLY